MLPRKTNPLPARRAAQRPRLASRLPMEKPPRLLASPHRDRPCPPRRPLPDPPLPHRLPARLPTRASLRRMRRRGLRPLALPLQPRALEILLALHPVPCGPQQPRLVLGMAAVRGVQIDPPEMRIVPVGRQIVQAVHIAQAVRRVQPRTGPHRLQKPLLPPSRPRVPRPPHPQRRLHRP